jgi:hypothetical protein
VNRSPFVTHGCVQTGFCRSWMIEITSIVLIVHILRKVL